MPEWIGGSSWTLTGRAAVGPLLVERVMVDEMAEKRARGRGVSDAEMDREMGRLSFNVINSKFLVQCDE